MTTTLRGALRATARSAALALATTLVACGGGGSNDTPIVYDNHLPLQVGDRRVYRERGSDLSGSLGTTMSISTETVTGTLQVDGTLYHLVRSSGGRPSFGSLYAASASGIQKRSIFDTWQSMDAVRFPTQEGASFVQDRASYVDLDLDGVPDPYSARVTTLIVGVETLSTPAGEFSGALHVREHTVSRIQMSRAGTDNTMTGHRDTWYVPGVGAVRWESRDDYYAGIGELMRHVPAGRPDLDTAPPVLVRAGPSSGTNLHAGAPLVLTFNEPVTASGLDAVTVLNSRGEAVHLNRVGPFDPEGRSLNLSPSFGWDEGAHTVRIAAGIQDLAGNTMVALPDSTFTVSSNFALVYANIPPFTVDAQQYNGPLSASMNESIDPSTLMAVRLRENGVLVPATVSSDRNSLQVTPAAPLKPSTRYTVDLDGLRSAAGLTLANPQDWTFTTAVTQKASGLAAPPQRSLVR